MNLITAINSGISGIKFKRKNWSQYISIQELHFIKALPQSAWQIAIQDIIAEDWEIEEEKIEITKSKFEEIWNSLWSEYQSDLKTMTERLGFK